MNVADLHEWPSTASEAIALQRELASSVELRPFTSEPSVVCGLDAAFSPDGADVIAGAVLLDVSSGVLLQKAVARQRCSFPYVSGLLSFREIPALLAVMRTLTQTPDVVLCDGQGIAHPRGLGLASHLGLWLGIPTVGCAKSRLCGEFDEPGSTKGSQSPLYLKQRVVGAVLRTREKTRPLFVSPGHLCDVQSAVRLTLAATTRFRLPEPTRQAHLLVSAARSTK